VALSWFLHWPFAAENSGVVQGWGFWLAVVGLMLTLVGFAITWVQLQQARTVAEAVNGEVKRIELSVQGYDAAHQATRAASALEAAKRHLRNSAWPDVADSYEEYRRSLLTLQQLQIDALKIYNSDITAANKYISRLLERIENEILSSHVDIE
jgi:hypothetical protein